MVEDDRRLREGARQIRQLHQLRVVQPRLEGQVERRQPRKSDAPGRIGHLALRRVGAPAREHLARIPDHRMADAPEAAVTGGDLRLQHARDAVAEAQIGVSDDAGTQPALAVAAAGAHRRCTVDEFDFADRLHLGRAVGAVHLAAFDKDALDDVVTAAGIGEQLVEQVAVPLRSHR